MFDTRKRVLVCQARRMFFEDYVPDQVTALPSIEVTREEVLQFARRYDPQPFHVDEAAAATGPFGGLIASGWHTCALTMRSLVDGFLDAASSLGSPGVDELRWPAPVRPGDVLAPRATVLDARVSKSKPDRGIVRARVEALNQDGAVALSMTATILVRRRP
jgi:acyl dehydratase